MLQKRILYSDPIKRVLAEFEEPASQVEAVEEIETVETIEHPKNNSNTLLIMLIILLVLAIGYFIYQNLIENE